MATLILESLAGLIDFVSYLGFSLILSIIFSYLYVTVTPYPEFTLIREGKLAPAISFGGALLGFILPMASAISHSVNFIDMMIWSSLALLMTFFAFRLVFPNLLKDIAEDNVSVATTLACASVAVGLLNAASMTY